MTATEPQVETQFDKLGEVVTKAMERLGVPGAAVGIFYNGQEYTAGFGVTHFRAETGVGAEMGGDHVIGGVPVGAVASAAAPAPEG